MEETKNAPRTLQELSPGESGMILSVGNQSGAVKRRLVDMGLTPGTVVKVTKIAPLGDPLEVSLRGYELSLRKDDAAQIQIGTPRRTPSPNTSNRSQDPEAIRRQLRDHVHELEHHGKDYDHNAHDNRPMKVALAGNPNCGKTTLFNALTGSNQYVGNWPGVTVEKKEGIAHLGDRELTVVDLPGIYSLSLTPWRRSWPGTLSSARAPMPSSTLWMPPTWSATSTSPFSSWSWSAPWCWL